jgi:hypothetical protein
MVKTEEVILVFNNVIWGNSPRMIQISPIFLKKSLYSIDKRGKREYIYLRKISQGRGLNKSYFNKGDGKW